MAEARESQRFSITLSAGTYALLKVQAEKDGRSLANTVNKIVTEALTNTIENRQYASENEERAFLEGTEAANAGKARDSNPYQQTPYEVFLMRLAWFDGWEDVQEDGILYERP